MRIQISYLHVLSIHRGKKHTKQGSYFSPVLVFINTTCGLISCNLKEVIMGSIFNIYTDFQLPLREVLKTLEGSE